MRKHKPTTNKNSIDVYCFNEKGKQIGMWHSISEAAKANKTTPSSVAYGIWSDTDHFSVGHYWLKDPSKIEESMAKHHEILAERQRLKEERQNRGKGFRYGGYSIADTKPETNGEYVFVPSKLSGAECCNKCALYPYKQCLPCREDEGHKHGYWRNGKKLSVMEANYSIIPQ